MRNIKLSIAYDGTHFQGWQKNSSGRSVEQELQKALEKILQEKIKLQAASRTDAGVHAEGQVVNFFTTNTRYALETLHKSLLAILPKDLVVLNIEEKEKDFHPTLSAKGKIYRYTISLGPYQLPSERFYAWHYNYAVDRKAMEEAAQSLLGTHDFTAFCNDQLKTLKDPICHLESIHFEMLNHQKNLIIWIQGNRFLYKMVRNLVGTLAYIGSSKMPISALSSILLSKDRTQAGITAPAYGLALFKIIY